MKQALIALGGNLGDVPGSFNYALNQLRTIGKVTAKSSIYKTKAVGGPPNQPDYLNAVIMLETNLESHELLKFLLKTEAERGRERRIKWGPRTLDLDMLDYDSQIISSDNLTLPHPRMWERAFVLMPLRDVRPDFKYPLTAQPLKARLNEIDKIGVKPANLNW